MECVPEEQAVDDNFSKDIFLSDEAHFTLGEHVNKQNDRIWDSENSQVMEERSLHPEKVTVFAFFGPKL